jgi:hypothetical protein
VSYFGLSETSSDDKAPPRPTSINGLPPLIMNKDTGNAFMERVVVKLLQHAGFEGILRANFGFSHTSDELKFISRLYS